MTHANFKDITGQTFGNLRALHCAGRLNKQHDAMYWHCECKCGSLHIARGDDLRNGRIWQCRRCADAQRSTSMKGNPNCGRPKKEK